jgi:hypothetical protein
MKPFLQKGSGLDKPKMGKQLMRPSILASATKMPALVNTGIAKKVLQTYKPM